MYKYYMWTDIHPIYDDKSGEWYHPMKGGDLLSYPQIQTLLSVLNEKQEGHATILDYDSEGKLIGCPLYFDIDMPSLWDAYHEMRTLVDDLRDVYDIEPAVYFSGSKGFHVVMPLFIEHERCHEIAKMIAQGFCDEIDTQVYRTRAMMRCTNTVNRKTGLFKVRVDPNRSLQEMTDYAGKPRPNPPIKYEHSERFTDEVFEAVRRLPPIRVQQDYDTDSEISPCIQRLWNLTHYDEGERHYIAFIFVRQFYRVGLSEQDTIEKFERHPFWKHYPPREYMKIVNSVYRSGKAYLGCQNGRDGEILRTYCVTLCGFNKKIKISDILKEDRDETNKNQSTMA